MLYNFIAYLKFLLKSQNQHGLHSPFVYSFVTKGLYNKTIKNNCFKNYPELQNLSRKQKNILSKIVNYFKTDTIYFDFLRFKKSTKNGFTILLIENISKLSKSDFVKLNSKDIIVIKRIYQNKKTYLKWLELTKTSDITVSIDLFYFGLILNRKEQAKEHFIIRV